MAAVAIALSSCRISYDIEYCDYSVELRYDYNEENTAEANMIEYYVYTLDEYIFDADGILYQHRTTSPDPCADYMVSQLDLPPGRYSVIAIGNMDERSTASDVAGTRNSFNSRSASPTPGVTRRENMLLTLQNCEELTGGTYGQSEKLYHGYKTFTVMEQNISRVRVDMINAHFSLKFRVTWKNNSTPARGKYYALLEAIPSEYKLMPEYIYPANSFECKTHECDADDLYPTNCNNVIHHIPQTCYQQTNILCHRNDTYINADNEMWGQFINYRIKTETKPVLRIFSDGTSRSGEDEQIIKDIDLQEVFKWFHYELDHTLKQEYELDIVVDGNTIIINPMRVGDWDEGDILKN